MPKEEAKINCPTFQKQKPIINDLTDKINKTEGVQEKARFAQELQKEVDILISCSNYDGKNLNCGSCRFIANLRKQTTNLIIKAEKLSDKKGR